MSALELRNYLQELSQENPVVELDDLPPAEPDREDARFQHLRRLIDGEDKAHPLSDQKLCEALAAEGCPISRRSVAKYRDDLNIPGAPGRKNRG